MVMTHVGTLTEASPRLASPTARAASPSPHTILGDGDWLDEDEEEEEDNDDEDEEWRRKQVKRNVMKMRKTMKER